MNKKIYLATLILGWSCLTTNASAQESLEKYDNTQQQEENIIKYQMLIKEDWHNTKAHNDLGESYLKLRRLDEAEKEFKAALETDRVYSMGPFLFGDVYTDAERYKNKILDFNKVIEQNNEFARSHNNLGAVRLSEKKLELARKEYLEALRINPKYAQAHNGLGMLHEKLGQLDQAIKEYKTALSIDEDNSVVNYNIGLAYNKKNDLDQSIPYLSKARDLYKKSKNKGQENYLTSLIANLTKTPVNSPEKIQLASNVTEDLNKTLQLKVEPVLEEADTTPKSQLDIQVANNTPHIDTQPNDPVSIKDETITEDKQPIKVLKVKTSNGEFLGNERHSPIMKKSEPETIVSTSLESSEVIKNVTVKKGPETKNEDPFLGDWLFEYPK